MSRIIALLGLAVLLFSCVVANSRATVLIVDNNPGHAADFQNLQSAHDNAANGDTLIVVGSAADYGHITINKLLYLYGPGYRVTENLYTQASPYNALLLLCTFEAGSEGSSICGFFIWQELTTHANNIVISRNYLTGYNGRILIYSSNCVVTNNYIYATHYNTSYHSVVVNEYGINCVISNNYIARSEVSGGSYALNVYAINVICTNNVIYGNINFDNGVFYNNIIRGNTVDITFSNSYVHHNLSAGSPLPNGFGNQENVDMNTVFLLTGSFDAQWQLLPGSPAIGAGANGEDCGMFGGPTPYVLSGIPGIPTISNFVAPFSASQESGLPVEIEIRSRN